MNLLGFLAKASGRAERSPFFLNPKLEIAGQYVTLSGDDVSAWQNGGVNADIALHGW